MQFQDELAGGVVLVRPALQSPDYLPGVSGWAVKIDGSAEFNNILIRGGGTSDPVVVGSATSPQVIIRTTAGNGLVVFPTNRPIELAASTLNSAVVNSGAVDERAELQLTGPTVTGATTGVRVVLRSQPNNASLPASFSIQDRTGATTFFAVDETEVRVVERRIDSRQLTSTGVVIAGYVTTDAFDRIQILGGGDIEWGSGAAARDVRMYREAANVLALDDTFRIYRSAAGLQGLSLRVTGDTTSRLAADVSGALTWGPGGATATDVTLSRSAVGTLQVAGALTVTGDLGAANYPSGAWTSFTPTWVTSTGANLPSFGNAAVNCAWTRSGKTYTVRYDIVFGSTTNFGAAPTTSDNWRFGLPVTAAAMTQVNGYFDLNSSSAARCIARSRFTTTGATELEISSGRPDAVAIVNNGIADSLSPWTWVSGDSVRGLITFEAA